MDFKPSEGVLGSLLSYNEWLEENNNNVQPCSSETSPSNVKNKHVMNTNGKFGLKHNKNLTSETTSASTRSLLNEETTNMYDFLKSKNNSRQSLTSMNSNYKNKTNGSNTLNTYNNNNNTTYTKDNNNNKYTYNKNINRYNELEKMSTVDSLNVLNNLNNSTIDIDIKYNEDKYTLLLQKIRQRGFEPKTLGDVLKSRQKEWAKTQCIHSSAKEDFLRHLKMYKNQFKSYNRTADGWVPKNYEGTKNKDKDNETQSNKEKNKDMNGNNNTNNKDNERRERKKQEKDNKNNKDKSRDEYSVDRSKEGLVWSSIIFCPNFRPGGEIIHRYSKRTMKMYNTLYNTIKNGWVHPNLLVCLIRDATHPVRFATPPNQDCYTAIYTGPEISENQNSRIIFGEYTGIVYREDSIPDSIFEYAFELNFTSASWVDAELEYRNDKQYIRDMNGTIFLPNNSKYVLDSSNAFNELSMVNHCQSIGAYGGEYFLQANCEWQQVIFDGWPHVILTNKQGVKIQTGDELIADFGALWFQKVEENCHRQLKRELIQYRLANSNDYNSFCKNYLDDKNTTNNNNNKDNETQSNKENEKEMKDDYIEVIDVDAEDDKNKDNETQSNNNNRNNKNDNNKNTTNNKDDNNNGNMLNKTGGGGGVVGAEVGKKTKYSGYKLLEDETKRKRRFGLLRQELPVDKNLDDLDYCVVNNNTSYVCAICLDEDLNNNPNTSTKKLLLQRPSLYSKHNESENNVYRDDDDEDECIVCDGCDRIFHTKCLQDVTDTALNYIQMDVYGARYINLNSQSNKTSKTASVDNTNRSVEIKDDSCSSIDVIPFLSKNNKLDLSLRKWYCMYCRYLCKQIIQHDMNQDFMPLQSCIYVTGNKDEVEKESDLSTPTNTGSEDNVNSSNSSSDNNNNNNEEDDTTNSSNSNRNTNKNKENKNKDNKEDKEDKENQETHDGDHKLIDLNKITNYITKLTNFNINEHNIDDYPNGNSDGSNSNEVGDREDDGFSSSSSNSSSDNKDNTNTNNSNNNMDTDDNTTNNTNSKTNKIKVKKKGKTSSGKRDYNSSVYFKRKKRKRLQSVSRKESIFKGNKMGSLYRMKSVNKPTTFEIAKHLIRQKILSVNSDRVNVGHIRLFGNYTSVASKDFRSNIKNRNIFKINLFNLGLFQQTLHRSCSNENLIGINSNENNKTQRNKDKNKDMNEDNIEVIDVDAEDDYNNSKDSDNNENNETHRNKERDSKDKEKEDKENKEIEESREYNNRNENNKILENTNNNKENNNNNNDNNKDNTSGKILVSRENEMVEKSDSSVVSNVVDYLNCRYLAGMWQLEPFAMFGESVRVCVDCNRKCGPKANVYVCRILKRHLGGNFDHPKSTNAEQMRELVLIAYEQHVSFLLRLLVLKNVTIDFLVKLVLHFISHPFYQSRSPNSNFNVNNKNNTTNNTGNTSRDYSYNTTNNNSKTVSNYSGTNTGTNTPYSNNFFSLPNSINSTPRVNFRDDTNNSSNKDNTNYNNMDEDDAFGTGVLRNGKRRGSRQVEFVGSLNSDSDWEVNESALIELSPNTIKSLNSSSNANTSAMGISISNYGSMSRASSMGNTMSSNTPELRPVDANGSKNNKNKDYSYNTNNKNKEKYNVTDYVRSEINKLKKKDKKKNNDKERLSLQVTEFVRAITCNMKRVPHGDGPFNYALLETLGGLEKDFVRLINCGDICSYINDLASYMCFSTDQVPSNIQQILSKEEIIRFTHFRRHLLKEPGFFNPVPPGLYSNSYFNNYYYSSYSMNSGFREFDYEREYISNNTNKDKRKNENKETEEDVNFVPLLGIRSGKSILYRKFSDGYYQGIVSNYGNYNYFKIEYSDGDDELMDPMELLNELIVNLNNVRSILLQLSSNDIRNYQYLLLLRSHNTNTTAGKEKLEQLCSELKTHMLNQLVHSRLQSNKKNKKK